MSESIIELLQELRDLAADVNPSEIIDHVSITRMGRTFDAQWLDAWHAEFDRIMQAIAATLGETYTREECEAAFVRGYSLGTLPAGSDPQWDENRQTVDEHMAELGWVRAATLGGGKLTAEQVRGVLLLHLPHREYYSIAQTDGWQAIANELNAAIGGDECELEETESHSNANEVIHVLECSACGETCEHVNGSYPRCPHCGRKTVRR